MRRNAPFPTRRLAEAYLQAQPTPTRPALRAFVQQQPRVLPAPKPAPAAPHRRAETAFLLALALLLLVLAFCKPAPTSRLPHSQPATPTAFRYATPNA